MGKQAIHMNYIATFFTHYGAMTFQRQLKSQGKAAKMSPVPRALSASCGVCVRFDGQGLGETAEASDLEGVYQETETGYRQIEPET